MKFDISNAIILFVVAISAVNFIEKFHGNEITYVKSSIDNRKYLVRNIQDKQRAANMLAKLRAKLKRFVKDIGKSHPSDNRCSRLNIRFKPDNLTESTINSKFTSYSINKGQKIVFCIRERDQQDQLVDLNTITFVALHELAHVMTIEIGHNDNFWNNFKFLLQFAIDNNYYTYQPFHLEPVKYCGTTISDTPLKLK